MRLRSYLYVPADKADRLEKAPVRGADALIIDLEDGVSLRDKDLARENLRSWLKMQNGDVNIWVRVNPEDIERDLEVAVNPFVKGIILPKSQSSEDIDFANTLLMKFGASKDESTFGIIALIETAEGVLNASSIARSERVTRLILGEIDLRADLSLANNSNDATIHFARNTIVYASAAAKIAPPIASVSTNFSDLDRYRKTTSEYASWGYFGRTCIHPAQIPIVNEIFAPSKDEIEWANDILVRFSHGENGSTLDSRGEMIDEAVAKIARGILGVN